MTLDRRSFLGRALGGVILAAIPELAVAQPAVGKRNFVLILCDDLGWGDIESHGGSVATPAISRLAREGIDLTDYYSPGNLGVPGRAGILTGRYAIRTGVEHEDAATTPSRDLLAGETTLAQALGPEYTAAMIGDWLHGERDEGADARQLLYSRAEAFLDANRERPFLLGLALPAPSVPAQPNAAFAGKSEAGAYGDLLFEIDSIVGRLIAKLQALRIERSTLVIFSSANGAGFEGSNGPLRGRRGDAGYDGGYRVPLIAWAPGLVRAGTSDAILSGVDLLPTLVSLAGVAPPQGVELDGLDASAVLTRGAPSPREEVLLFDGDEVVAVRTRQWKYVERTSFRNRPVSYETAGLEELYDMVRDRSESYSVAAMNPYVAQDMKKRLARARARFAPLKRRA